MTNPILVEVTRGGIAESGHRGAIAVVDSAGKIVLAIGEIDQPVFPRSAIKGLQAIPLIESGAAEKFGLTDEEIALACASHNGEERHVAAAASVLRKAGRDVGTLECGAQFPMRANAGHPLIRAGLPATALHNNCSGKHAGFVCTACANGDDPLGYVKPGHPTMRAVTAAVSEMTGYALDHATCGTDGCSIPTFAIPLKAMALAFARFGSGQGLLPERAKAVTRIRQAVANAPFFVAGTDRYDTKVMEILKERAFLKTGAEGVYCAALPELGLGIALKCDDGTSRAAEVMVGAMLTRFLTLSDSEHEALQPLLQPALRNWNGIHVGDVRPTEALSAPYSQQA
jgi:L-asparaginase II